MAKVFDVAKYIVKRQGTITTAKLQKLVYYSQAWSLVWDEKPLFNNEIQAWANGPVSPDLFQLHKGKFQVSSKNFPKGDTGQLNVEEMETIDSVLKYYGDKSAQWLIDLTHLEDPWKEAREGCAAGERCTNEITIASMMDYYSGL
jgi:uncharacterized phage-associated protein